MTTQEAIQRIEEKRLEAFHAWFTQHASSKNTWSPWTAPSHPVAETIPVSCLQHSHI
jgi:hypothetical protein